MVENLKNVFFRIWYWYISTVDKNAEVIFMNYGYSKNAHRINLSQADEPNRYSIQLYDYVARRVEIKGTQLLEVGSGRGGGLSYINRYLSPKSATGLDLCQKAIDFCSKNYAGENIEFVQGNAQQLPMKNEHFDVVLNVESSHRYPEIETFFSEVYRVLKPGGHFVITDFRASNEITALRAALDKSGLKMLSEEMITREVVEALDHSTKEREALIQKLAPKFLHSIGKDFAATQGSPTYHKFASQQWEYFLYVLTK